MTKTADILGKVKPVKATPLPDNCFVCGKPLEAERIEALKTLGISTTRWAHTKCSQEEKVKGVYMGEVGTSKLQVVDKLYNDSVHDAFVDGALDDSE